MPSNILKPFAEIALLLTMRPAHTERARAVHNAVLARIEGSLEASAAFRTDCAMWIAAEIKGA